MITKEILKSGDAFVIKTINTQEVEVQTEVDGELVTTTKEQVSFAYSNPVTVAELTAQKETIAANIAKMQSETATRVLSENKKIEDIDEILVKIHDLSA